MRRQDQHCYNILIKALQENDLTYKEMMQISGFSYFGLIRLVARLKEEKVLHICGYYKDKTGKDTIKIFRYGKGRDAKRGKMKGSEKQRNYIQRKMIKSIPTSLIAGVSL